MLSLSRLVMMRNHVLFLVLFIFVSLANLSTSFDASDKECKSFKKKSVISDIIDHITCHNDIWLRSDMDHEYTTTTLYVSVNPFSVDFDDDTNLLNLRSTIVTYWNDKRLAWDPQKFGNVTYIKIPTPEIVVLSADSEDTYNHRVNSTTCRAFYQGRVACVVQAHQKIRCHTDFTLWPYDRHNCPLMITSWSHTTKDLTFARKSVPPPIELFGIKYAQEWNIWVSRISYDPRPSDYYYEKIYYPKILIDLVVDRLHSPAKGRFAASTIIMMAMTLITLWFDPKSIERLAISSLNIIIHMICVRDLHRALPRNSPMVPNILLFYVNSFVLAILAIFLTYILGKLEDTKIRAPKWIMLGTDFILKSKAGKILLLCMLDPKATDGIEAGADDNRDISCSGSDKLTWKYVSIFIGWMAFFSFFFAYVLMYALLIPNSSWRPPVKEFLYPVNEDT